VDFERGASDFAQKDAELFFKVRKRLKLKEDFDAQMATSKSVRDQQ
jgi:hypothetical protein